MFKHLQKLLLIAALCVPWVTQAQGDTISTFPVICDFEDATENAHWSFANGTAGWYIGTATNNGGTHSLYVSEDNGANSSYSGAECVSYAYLTFDITDAGDYALSFDWKCQGESTYDFLRVAVGLASTALPTTYSSWTATAVPTGFTAVDGGNKLNLNGTSWQTKTAVITVTTPGVYRLLFVWRNDGSVYNQPPAAIDNVAITELTCPQPTALSVIPSADQLDITWTAGGSETAWKVVISDTVVDYVTTNSYTATNLEANTPYTVKVYAICGVDDTSFAIVGSCRTSCVAISQLPYSNGFEDEPYYLSGTTTYAEAFPNCWTRINDATGSTNYYPYISTTASYAHSGTKGMYWYQYNSSSYAQNEYAVLPPIDSDVYDIADLTLSFYAKTTSTNYNPMPVVGVMTNPSDASTFTAVHTFTSTDITTNWQLFAVSLADYTGTGNYIAIKWSNPGSTSYMAIDDIFLTDEWCDIPLNLTASSTTDEITISWEANGGSSFTVFLGDDTIGNVTDTFYTFTNLIANTEYSYGVSTECSNSNSAYVTGSIRTLCVLIDSLPYSYGFEDLATGSSSAHPAIPCWHHINNATSYFGYPYVSSTTPHSGTRNLYWYASTTAGTYGDYQIVVLPGIDANVYPINSLRLKFWARPSSTSYHPVFRVGVMDDPNDVSTFQEVQTVNVQNVTTWQEFAVMFGNYTGSGNFIAVRVDRPSSSSYYVYTDDFTIEEAPSCPSVVSHQVTATASAALIAWSIETDFATDPDSYEVSYGYASDNLVGATTLTTTDPVMALTGLDPDTSYMVSIVGDCSGSNANAYTFTFSTQALPCIEWDTTGNAAAGPADTVTVGTPGTSTSEVMPVNNGYNYSYCQHLILSSHVSFNGPTAISGIAFDYAYTQPMTHATNCMIYMGNTTRSTFSVSSPADSMFIPYSDLTLVYQGPLNCTTNGYNYFNFNQGAFQYDGTSNIVVAVVNNSGSYDGTAYKFRYQTTSPAMTHRVYNNTTPYGPTEMDAARANQSMWRTNMKLLTGGGGECIATATCMAPAVNAVQNDEGNIEISWIPGYQETDWDLDYRDANSTTWTNILTGTTSTNYTMLISDLQPNTQYYFRVTANCDDTNMSSTASITTPCSFISIPYTYGFEDMATGSSSARPNIPCWNHINNGTSYYGYPYVSSTAHNSTRSLYWYLTTTTGTYGDYELVVMPPVDIVTNPINTLQLTFWAKPTSTSYAPVFLVGVMTDPEDVTTFQFVDSVVVDHTTTDWNAYEVTFLNYTGNGRYIAVRANRPSSLWYAYTDDFTIENAPACPRIAGVEATSITQNSATISWDATAASEYEVQYGPAGFTMGSGSFETNIIDDSVGLYGLSANTAYDVYVRGICTEDTSNWSFVYTFRTACGSIDSLPFTEDFESQLTGTSSTGSPFIPCWTRINNGTSYAGYPYVSATSSYNHTQGGTKGLYWYNSTTATTYGDYQYIILPDIDTTVYPINNLQLSFWAKSSSTSYYPVFQVGVMNSNTDTAFQYVATVDIGNNTTWTEYVTNFTGFTGSGNYLAIRALRPTSSWYAYVDDITLDIVPPCSRVEDLHVVNVTLDSITIVWTDTSSTNTTWVVEYDSVDFVPGSGDATAYQVTDTVFSLAGLDSATTYHIYVYPVCDDYVGYRHITAATLVASPASLPYTCDFEEDGPNGWDLFVAGQTNYWMVGNAVNNGGTRSLYVTNDGSTHGYTNTTISYSYAVRNINFSEAGEYGFSFDWMCSGEGNYDFIRAFVVPATVNVEAGVLLFGTSSYNFGQTIAPDNFIDLAGRTETPYALNQQATWQTRSDVFTITTPGNYKLVFCWSNDGSGGSNPPGAIDNVSIVQNVCPSVDNLALSYVTVDSAIVSWNSFPEQTSFVVEYDSVPFSAGNGSYSVITTDTSYIITGLTAGVTYYVIVRGECNGDTSLASSFNFTTMASYPATVPYLCDFEQPGVNGWDLLNGNEDNYWIVGNAVNNGGSRSMYITDDGTSNSYSEGASYVFAVRYFNLPAGNYVCSYDWRCNGESSYDFMRVALVPASANIAPGSYCGFDNASAMPAGSIALDGANRMNLQTSWQTQVEEFTLTTPGSYKLVFLWRNDGSIYNLPPAAIDNIQLVLNTCPMPQNIAISSLTQTGADFSWVETGGATTWEYQIDNGTPVVVTDTFCTVNGLVSNTPYTFRVRSYCSAGDTSMWTSYNFRTPCGSISLPYIQDFEAEATGSSTTGSAFANCWTHLNNGTSYGGYPYISSTSTYNHTPNGTKGLYWYNSTTANTYGDYQCIVLPPVDQSVGVDSLQLSFWTRASSATYTPVFQIGVMTDPNNIASFVGVDTVSITSGTTWMQVEVPLVSYTGNGQYVAIKADRPASLWYAYVDDIELGYVPTCLMPHNVTSTEASMTSITIDWTDYSAASEWEIRYGTTANNTTTITTTSHPYTVTGLDTLTSYNFEVRAICTVGDTSRWSEITVLGTEFCDNAFAASTGPATGTSYYVPVNNFYKYTLSETIIDSAELAGIGDISVIAYSYAYSSPSTDKTDVTIYLQPTTKTVFSSGSDIELLDTNTAVQVYSGNLNCSQGWNYFILDTIYTWDGHSNLMVIVDDNSNDYNTSSHTFNNSSSNGYKTLVWYSDTYNPDPTSTTYSGTKTYYQYRPTMKLVSCNGVSCRKPQTPYASNVTYSSATLNWTSIASTDFEVAVKAATEGTWPVEVAVGNATTYNVNGLQPNTQYQFRVRSICDATEGLISDWIQGTFTTAELPCFVPTDLHTTTVGYTNATLAWNADASQNQWAVHVWNSTFDSIYIANINPFTVNGLENVVSYSAAVKSVCGGGLLESEYGDTVTFTTAACAQVTGVAVNNVTVSTATVTWNGTALSYELEYGDENFSQGTGTFITTSATSASITGLDADETYDVYVRAICETGVISDWSTKVTFTTQTGTETLYPISVTSNNDQWGTVSGGGDYPMGANVTLSATPNQGYRFVSWNDGVLMATRTITVTGPASYMATFEAIPTYTVTVSANPSNAGTVTGGGTYEENTVITISATANSGYFFVSWDDGNTEATRQITVTENHDYVATFLQEGTQVEYFSVTVTSNNEQWGTVSGSRDSVIGGSVVGISATANEGYRFVSWNDGNTNASRNVTVTSDTAFQATFEALPTYHITVVANPAEGGTVTGTGDYVEGSTVTISATPNTGYEFVNWSDNVTTASRQITVTADATYTANFRETQGIISQQPTANSQLSIYPNPTTDATTIAVSGVNGEVQITIVDMNGRTVKAESMSCNGDCTKRMEVSGLAQGAYFVRVNGEGINMVRKLVVK